MDDSEGLDPDEGDNASRATVKGHSTDPREFKPLLDKYASSFISSGAQPKHLANSLDSVALTLGMPFRGVGEPNEYPAINNLSPADASHPQAPHLVLEKIGPSFHRRNPNGVFPAPDRSPQSFAQLPFNTIGHLMASDPQAGRMYPSGYWNSDQNAPVDYTQDPLLWYGATGSDLADNLGPNVPENGHYVGPTSRIQFSYTSPVVSNMPANPVAVPDWSGCIPQDADLGRDVPAYIPYGLLERPICQSIYRIYNQAQTSASQPLSPLKSSFIPSVVAEFNQQPSYYDGYYPHPGSSSNAMNTSFPHVVFVPGAPVDSDMTVPPVDVRDGDPVSIMDCEPPSNEPNLIWGQGAALGVGSSSKSRHTSTLSSRFGVKPPSPCHSLGPVAGAPVLQQVEPKSTEFARDSVPKEIRDLEGLEQKLDIPETFQDVFDLRTGKTPITKSRRRPTSKQRRNTSFVRKVGACEICRAGKRRCECKLNQQYKGAGNSDKASQPRKRGPRKKPEVPHSAPVGCKQRCRSSMPLVNFNSPMAPSIPTERRQSSLPLATYATSNTSFSAESTGGQAMTNHASPPEGDMHNPIKLQWAEKVAESITEYPKGIGGDGREASLATVDTRTREIQGPFLVPQLPIRPVRYVPRQTSTDVSPRYQDMIPNPVGSTPEMCDVPLRDPLPIIPRPVSSTPTPLTNHIGDSTLIVATTQLLMTVDWDDSFDLLPTDYFGPNLGSEEGNPLVGDYDASVEEGWSEGDI